MEDKIKVRKPKQARSILLKEKILENALNLFCEKGYHHTTTNEIAKVSEVSIGSLYSYFKNKESILYEILALYHAKFLGFYDELTFSIDVYRADPKLWIRDLIEKLITLHEESSRFNRELNVLYYSDEKVREILDIQRAESHSIMLQYARQLSDSIRTDDIEAAAELSYDFISAIVDRIVFGDGKISRERLLSTGVEAIYKFLT